MESNPVIRGSGVSIFKPRTTKHTVSHVFVIDPRFSNWETSDVVLNPKCQNGFTSSVKCTSTTCGGNCFSVLHNQEFELGRSGLFSSASDGEVLWDAEISLLKIKATGSSDGWTYKHQMTLYIASMPEDLGVYYFAAVQTKLTEPFTEKPKGAFYTPVGLGSSQSGPIDLEWFEFQLEDDNQMCRLDLTYLVHTMDNGVVHTLQGPIRSSTKKSENKEPLPSYVAALLKNSLSSDITLEANGRKWHLHKCILSVRSPVFAAMFSTDMKEKKANTIPIEDVDNKAFDIMIMYIYSNEVGVLDEDTAISLLFLADRFDLPELREKCEANLTSRVNTENCLTFLVNAEKCNAKMLSTVAESILVKNFSTVFKTDAWKDFALKDFERSLEIVRKI